MSRLQWIKLTGIIAAALLVAACFMPWVYIASRDITVSGIKAEGTNYGRPGFFHLLMVALFILLTFIQKLWAKRLNLLVTALNLAWALRNLLVIPACYGGDCPEKKIGLFLMLFSSIAMLIASLFPDMKLPQRK